MTTTTQKTAGERRYDRKEVIQIIRFVMANVGGETEMHKRLQKELKVLSDYIEGMRAELAQMRSIEISHKHIPAASDELDAVVGETAAATGTIMDSCEQIEKAASGEGGVNTEMLTDAITKIYEACSFQDITGQRITKVIKTLKNIEVKVGEILSAFGHPLPDQAQAEEKVEKPGEVLNGPQLAGGSGISQDEIDKLLAGFD